ncbi:MAG: hypothetical protein ABI670_19455 [Chloroflexota bacterium]
MNDYDIYLRHASVRDGDWVGFVLGWRGLAGKDGLPQRPQLRWRPWIPDVTDPSDPALGHAGKWQWRFDVAMFDGMVGLLWTSPADGRSSADMRADLLAFVDLPALELKDADGTVYIARATAYREQCMEQYTPTHPDGGWLAQLDFVETTV